MRLEKAAQFAEGATMAQREARQFRAAIESGTKCSRCSQPAKALIDGAYVCAECAKALRQRRERERMRGRA
jgi:DNA-directed RNA polymerase subunit RPC12/RpoP